MGARNTPAGGSKTDKLWRDAIIRAVKRRQDIGGSPWLEKLADKLVQCAMDGDISAMKEIGDRIDGRATAEITGPAGGPIQVAWADQ